MKDRIRYSEAFKLKVMEELRDAKSKSVQEAARAYGIAEMSVYNWMHKLGFEHLKGRLIYVRTRTELDRIKELEDPRCDWPELVRIARGAGTRWLVVKPTRDPKTLDLIRKDHAYLKGLIETGVV